MALSKRFASITVPKDEDDSNDELLQRLLKKPTNFDQIEPSNLGFSSHRDVPGAGDSDEDDDLDEDWADDFQSLLKSCGSQKAVSSKEASEASKNTERRELNKNSDDANNTVISKNRNQGLTSSDLAGSHDKADNVCSEKKSHPVIEDERTSSKKAPIRDRADSFDNHKRKGTEVSSSEKKNIAIEKDKKKVKTSDNKTTVVPSKLKTEKTDRVKEFHVIDEKGSKISDHKIKKQEAEKIKGSCESEVKQSSIKSQEKKNNVDTDSVKIETKQRSDRRKESHNARNSDAKHSIESDSVKAETKQRSDKTKERHNDRKSDAKHSIEFEGTSHGKSQMKISESSEKREDKHISVKHKVMKNQSEISDKITHKEMTVQDEAFTEQKLREAIDSDKVVASDKKEIHSKSKTRDPDTKKNRPYIIKQATSFPLDDLLPAAAPIKKPRTSLDSQISSSRQSESPSSARKRHKSEMIPSQQIGAKKQKIDVQPRFRIDETDFERNESGNISYIPPDIVSLLAAVDTNQSLLTFFRQKLHKETGSKLLGRNLCDDPITKPSGFYTERNETEIHTEIDNKSSEELFHLLVQQCSELAKTEEDRSKLQSLVDLLKAESGSEFAGTGFTPELEVDNYKSPPPPSPSKHSPPSPYSPKSKQIAPESFEGRTLLKGGVEPRHIPKNFLTKCGKSRPIDPRTYTTTEQSLVLPLPKFAEEFWKKEKVKQLRKKNLAIKDDLKKKQEKAAKGHQMHVGNKLDPRLAKLHESKPNIVENHPVHKVDENQNLLTNDKVETSITGVSAFKAIHDPGFYAAVASVFSGDDEMIQPKNVIKLSSDIDINAGSKLKSPHMIPVLINHNGVENPNYDRENTENPVITGHNAVTASHDEPVHLSNLVQIETNMNMQPSLSNALLKPSSQTGPCIGIVKPMQVHNETKPYPGQSNDGDTRQMNMELSDTEEGEINDMNFNENKVPDTLESHGFNKQSKRKNGQTHEKEKRIFDRLKQKDEEDRRNTDDDRSSCSSASSASSRGRHHRRSWRGGHYDNNTGRDKRSRSRYSSCSSVESRSSDKQHSERKRYHSQREGSYSHREDQRYSYRPYHDDRQFHRGNRGRCDNKAKFYDRKSQYGKPSYSGKSGYDRRHVERFNRGRSNICNYAEKYDRERSNSGSYAEKYDRERSNSGNYVEKYDRERSNSGNYESRKIVVNDKRETKSATERKEREPLYDTSNVTKHLIEITDSEDEKLLMDYRQKFGNKSSPQENSDSSTAVSQSIPLPESYNADKEFLNYSLKKMEMANKVKHDYAEGLVTVNSQDKQEEYQKSTETFLKNRKDTLNRTSAEMSSEKLVKQTKSVPKPISFKVQPTKSVHDRISAKSQGPVKPTPSVHDRIGFKPQVAMKHAKSVRGRIGAKPHITINRPQAAADGTGVFKYSDMISLADLEET